MYHVTIPVFIDAAHQLPDSESLVTKACARLHGHTYHIVVNFDANNERDGMTVDFKAIKNIIDQLDHQFINEIFEQRGITYFPTAENIAKFIYGEITYDYPDLENLQILVAEGFKGKDKSAYVSYQE